MAVLKKHILLWVLIPLLILAGGASYYRFMDSTDYLVNYEGACDPNTAHCYVDCADAECSEEYYYTIVERHARDIEALCGPDVSDCEAASTCTVSEKACSVTYCDPVTEADSCEDINATQL